MKKSTIFEEWDMATTLYKFELDVPDENKLLIERHRNPSGITIPLHWHEFLEFEIVVSGTIRHTYNHRQYLLSRGSAYMTSYHDLHELTTLTDAEIYSVHFTRQILDPEIMRCLDHHRFHCQLSEEEAAWVIGQLDKLSRELDCPRELSHILIKNVFSEIMIMMIRKSSPEEQQVLPETIQRVLAYMNENFRHKLTLKQAAEYASFTPNYLGQLFRQQMNCSFNEYLHVLRLRYACSLLQTSALSIKEIASASGYNSTEHFVSCFKQKMQRTPGEYRRQQANLP